MAIDCFMLSSTDAVAPAQSNRKRKKKSPPHKVPLSKIRLTLRATRTSDEPAIERARNHALSTQAWVSVSVYLKKNTPSESNA